ncbi:hypothetical protein IWQ57_006152, partial [Coemansia nantahalensis]
HAALDALWAHDPAGHLVADPADLHHPQKQVHRSALGVCRLQLLPRHGRARLHHARRGERLAGACRRRAGLPSQRPTGGADALLLECAHAQGEVQVGFKEGGV